MPRLFFGIPLPASATNEIKKAIHPLKSYPGKLAWQREEKFHITTHFIGDVSPRAAEAIKYSFEKIPLLPRTEITLGGNPPIQTFGNDIVHVPVSSSKPALQTFHDLCWQLAPTSGTKAFRPHLTLARNPKSVSLAPLLEKGKEISFTYSFNPGRLTLFESIQEKGSTHYRSLAEKRFSKGKTLQKS